MGNERANITKTKRRRTYYYLQVQMNNVCKGCWRSQSGPLTLAIPHGDEWRGERGGTLLCTLCDGERRREKERAELDAKLRKEKRKK
jgi:hypothetical protein